MRPMNEHHYRYTKHQIARGSRPDAVAGGHLIPARLTTILRATHRIRMLLFVAVKNDVKLVLRLRRDTRLSPALLDLMREHGKHVSALVPERLFIVLTNVTQRSPARETCCSDEGGWSFSGASLRDEA